jgi:hypothetical protein
VLPICLRSGSRQLGRELQSPGGVAGVFHHISPEHADLYFHETGFGWTRRTAKAGFVGNSLRPRDHPNPRVARAAAVPTAAGLQRRHPARDAPHRQRRHRHQVPLLLSLVDKSGRIAVSNNALRRLELPA